MLSRLYINNFRCFVNFEYRPGRRQLLLGKNGTGKSSLIKALLLLKQFVLSGQPSSRVFFSRDRTRWLEQATQSWEVEATLGNSVFLYRLLTEADLGMQRVVEERISVDGNPILQCTSGEVRLFDDQFRISQPQSGEFRRVVPPPDSD